MGFEIPISNDYPNHPKTLHLISLIGPEADVYPLRLWFWASKYRRDGNFKGGAPEIELACGWKGAKGRLHRALIKAGFVESGGRQVHDWKVGIGRAIAIYERKKQKQREKYDADKGILPEEFRQNSPNSGNNNNNLETLETRESLPEEAPPSEMDIQLIERAATKPNYKAGLLLLLSIEVRKDKAGDLAMAYPWGRIAEVVRSAKGQENPGGWAIKALEEQWAVLNPFTEADFLHLAKNGNGQEAAK